MCLASERMIFANFYNKTKVSSCEKNKEIFNFLHPKGKFQVIFGRMIEIFKHIHCVNV